MSRRRSRKAPAAEAAPAVAPKYGGSPVAALLFGMLAWLQVAVPLVPSESAAEGTGAIFAQAWFLVAIFTLVMLPRLASTLRLDAAGIVTLLLGAWIFLSAVMRAWSGNPRATWNVTWQWLALLASFWALRHCLVRAAERRALVAVMIALSMLLASHGLYQFFYGMPLQRDRYDRATERQKQEILRANGVDSNPRSPERRHFEDRLDSTEPFATFALANSLAGVLAPWLIVTGGLLLAPGQLSGHARRIRVALGAAAAVIVLCLVLTKSRAAWIGTAAGAGVLLAVLVRMGERRLLRRCAFALAGIAAAIAIGVGTGALDREVVTQVWLSATYRFQYWHAATAMMAEYPLFGSGPGNFQDYYTRYKLPIASETVADPHNLVLEAGATAGIAAGLLLLAFLLWITWTLVRRTVKDWSMSAVVNLPDATASGAASGAIEQLSILAIYAGGIVAVLLAVWLGVDAGIAPDMIPRLDLPVTWALGVPIFAGVLYGLHPWVQGGVLPRLAILGAWLAATINLLAAGGITYPGVAQTFWLLAALGLALDERPASLAAPVHSWSFRSMAAGLLAVALASGCWLNGLRPVRAANYWLDRAPNTTSFEQAELLYAQAAEADPWDPRPWQWLAELYQIHWLQDATPRRETRIQLALEEARERDARSFAFAMREGWLHLQRYRAAGENEALRHSLSAYRRAAELYPNSNYVHAQLAWVLHLAGDESAARAAADRALALDALNPHIEQKLSQRTLADPADTLDGEPYGRPAPTANAEQVMYDLRSRGKI